MPGLLVMFSVTMRRWRGLMVMVLPGLGGDGEEGGGDVVIVVQPAEEGGGNYVTVGVDRLEGVTGLEMVDGNLGVVVDEGHVGQGREAGGSGGRG